MKVHRNSFNGFQAINKFTYKYGSINIQARVMDLVQHNMLSHHALQMYEVSSKYLKWFSSSTADIKLHLKNDQREITLKMYKPEFLCMTSCLILLQKCTEFH